MEGSIQSTFKTFLHWSCTAEFEALHVCFMSISDTSIYNKDALDLRWWSSWRQWLCSLFGFTASMMTSPIEASVPTVTSSQAKDTELKWPVGKWKCHQSCVYVFTKVYAQCVSSSIDLWAHEADGGGTRRHRYHLSTSGVGLWCDTRRGHKVELACSRNGWTLFWWSIL